jgi:hypothetical protein
MAQEPVFLATLLLSFAFTLTVAGIFGARFGQGRSRAVGIMLSLVGVIVAAIFLALTWQLVPGLEPVFDPNLVSQSLVAVGAATVGAIVAIATFIASVMRT